MGRHTAPDGDAVHPVVAAALARRAVDAGGAHRDEARERARLQAMERFTTQRIDGNVGWPGEPPAPGGGLGWPGEPADGAGSALSADDEDDDLAEPPGAPSLEPAARRRGWRRLLGRAA